MFRLAAVTFYFEELGAAPQEVIIDCSLPELPGQWLPIGAGTASAGVSTRFVFAKSTMQPTTTVGSDTRHGLYGIPECIWSSGPIRLQAQASGAAYAFTAVAVLLEWHPG